MDKKEYRKPEIVHSEQVEGVAGACTGYKGPAQPGPCGVPQVNS